LQQVIEPALTRDEVVLCDRFTDAPFAYQGGGRGFDLEVLTFLEQLVQTVKLPQGKVVRQPDLTIWFDLAPDIAAQRLAGARVPDKFEAQPTTFFASVRSGYQARFEADPPRFARIAAEQNRETVWQDVMASVKQRGWLA
jgi:dTMP kinase